jgi:amino acid permease
MQVFIVIFYTFVSHDELPPSGDVELFRFGSSFITSLPVQVFAFTCSSSLASPSPCLRAN